MSYFDMIIKLDLIKLAIFFQKFGVNFSSWIN